MHRLARYRLSLLVAAVVATGVLAGNAEAQVSVQLPSVSVFDVRTVVSVPDGGTMYLGGIRRSASGSVSRGVPLLSNIPGAGRLFKNRAIGRETTQAGMSVSAKILSLQEMEEDLMGAYQAQQRIRQAQDRNGPVAIQRKADFITRHIGRRRKPRSLIRDTSQRTDPKIAELY